MAGRAEGWGRRSAFPAPPAGELRSRLCPRPPLFRVVLRFPHSFLSTRPGHPGTTQSRQPTLASARFTPHAPAVGVQCARKSLLVLSLCFPINRRERTLFSSVSNITFLGGNAATHTRVPNPGASGPGRWGLLGSVALRGRLAVGPGLCPVRTRTCVIRSSRWDVDPLFEDAGLTEARERQNGVESREPRHNSSGCCVGTHACAVDCIAHCRVHAQREKRKGKEGKEGFPRQMKMMCCGPRV